MLLLHEFYHRKFLLPDKMRSKDREQLVKAAKRQAGGIEEEPDEGESSDPEYWVTAFRCRLISKG